MIEAIRIEHAPVFAVGVQWHAEWPRPVSALNASLFQAFGAAAQARARDRLRGAGGVPQAAE